jgi:hypothetical protein
MTEIATGGLTFVAADGATGIRLCAWRPLCTVNIGAACLDGAPQLNLMR